MNECHTLTQQNDENPKDKEPGMEIDEAGDILYTQKGKYYIRGITPVLRYLSGDPRNSSGVRI